MFRLSLLKIPRGQVSLTQARSQSDGTKGLVLGIYDGCDGSDMKLTASGEKLNEEVGGALINLAKGTGIKLGSAQVFSNIHPEHQMIALAGLGPQTAGLNQAESLDQCKENIRVAAGSGALKLKEMGAGHISVEGFTLPEPAAEGASLAVWDFQEYKSAENKTPPVKVDLFEHPDREGWMRGFIKGQAQNIARQLEETPGNQLTPSKFAQKAIDILCPCGVQVDIRDKDWIESKKMQAFLKVAGGSCEAPLLMEIGYCGGNPEEKSVLLIGKGITFDSGGINLKKCKGMCLYRADMAGAAVAIGVMRCAAQMNLPINVQALIPCAENMMGGMSMKPGDVVIALNGKTVRIENTDHEGRVILSDILPYSATYKPCLMLTVASLSSGMEKTLGAACSGVFTSSDVVWKELLRAGIDTGDRVWRFPFWKHFAKEVTNYTGVDINNVGRGTGSICLGASFIKEFVPPGADFAHMDITGTGMRSHGIGFPYLKKGLMTGRPVRTLAQFLYQMACPHEKPEC